jgi:Fe2+ or Zn2+ uptake regulation protein
MYDYLQNHGTGRSLYTLYQALKRQSEKGPVDAITGEACYSLSEQNLLCEKVDAKMLVI